VIPDPWELAAYTLERQHPLTRKWVDDQTRLALLAEQHAALDILLATDRSIAESRVERMAPGTPVDAMLNHWVAVGDDLHAMLSMRFEGLDITKPVDGVWAGYVGALTESEEALALPNYFPILIGTIHANNTGATTAATQAGRQDIGGWLLQPL
jgi:hypothetical protein